MLRGLGGVESLVCFTAFGLSTSKRELLGLRVGDFLSLDVDDPMLIV